MSLQKRGLLLHVELMSSHAGLVCPLGDPSPCPVLSSRLPGGLCGPVLYPSAMHREQRGEPRQCHWKTSQHGLEPLRCLVQSCWSPAAIWMDWLIDRIKGGSHHLKGRFGIFFSTRLKQNHHRQTSMQNSRSALEQEMKKWQGSFS